MKAKQLFISMIIPAWIAVSAIAQAGEPAQTSESQSEAYRAGVAQEALKSDVAAIRAELDSLRDEMRQLMPQDAATVDRAFKQLDALSKNEMEKAVDSLKNASRTGDLKSQLTSLLDASKDQGAIGTRLKRMAVDLSAHQSVAAIGPKLNELLRRQVAAMNEVMRLAKIEKLPAKLRDQAKRRMDVVADDQNGIAEDIKLVIKEIDDLSQNLPDDSKKPLVKAVEAARNGKLADGADFTVKLTREGPLDAAGAAQKSVTLILVEMEQALYADGKMVERLQAVLDDLNRILGSQRQVADAASKVRVKQSMPYEFQRLESGLSDQSEALRVELQVLNANAAGEVQIAQEMMEKSVANFIRMWEEREQAQQNTAEGVKRLETAKAELEKQIAQASEKAQLTPQQLSALLEQLQREVLQAAMDQNRVAQASKTPNSPFMPSDAQRQALLNKVGDLQQQALPVSPDAAQDLSKAAEEMAQPGADAQQAAEQSLTQAAQALAAQDAALNGRSPEQQALAKAENQLAQAQQDAAQAQKDLQANQTAQATNELNAAQQEAAAAAQTAAAAMQNTPDAATGNDPQQPGAQQAMQQAQQDLNQAKMEAAQQKGGQAQADAKAAQGAMQQAMQAMQQASQAMAQAAGNQAGNTATQNSPDNPNSQGNGGGGPSGDFLKGAGAVGGPAQVVTGLSPRDRDAVAQFKNEKPPREFVSDVQQYYKNLADGAGF